MIDLRYLKASDGTGSAILAHITTNRLTGATTLKVDSVSKWPSYFIATTGTLSSTGYIVESGKREFLGHLSGNDIIIDSFQPGFTDGGNTTTEVVILKQTTGWADGVSDTLRNVLNDDSTMKKSAIEAALGADQVNGWRTSSVTPTAVVDNGNGSYDLTFPSSVASFLSPKMRGRTTRNTASLVQSGLLNGTSQYFNRSATINNMLFTDDFVVGVWIKISNYQSGTVFSRTNGVNGWNLVVDSIGRIILNGINGSASNFSSVTSTQSIPLNRWVHIAAQLDMSAFTTSSTTSYIMIDGINVPVSVSRGGTNPTSLGQGGNIEIGSQNGGTSLFAGKIAQVFVTSAKVTQANVRIIKNQGIIPAIISAYNIVSAYSLSNSLLDLNTANANDLTAQNSASTTSADAPWGNQADGTISNIYDYMILQKVNGTVVTAQLAEGCTIPTSGTISAFHYSHATEPYGFPGIEDKWCVYFINRARQTWNTPGANTVLNPNGLNIMVPTGEWLVKKKLTVYVTRSVTGVVDGATGLGLTTSTMLPNSASTNYVANTTEILMTQTSDFPISMSVMTPLYLLLRGAQPNMTQISFAGDFPDPYANGDIITLKNALL